MIHCLQARGARKRRNDGTKCIYFLILSCIAHFYTLKKSKSEALLLLLLYFPCLNHGVCPEHFINSAEYVKLRFEGDYRFNW